MTSIFSSNLNATNGTSTFGGTLFGNSQSTGVYGSSSGLFGGNTYGSSGMYGSNFGYGGYGYFGNTFGSYFGNTGYGSLWGRTTTPTTDDGTVARTTNANVLTNVDVTEDTAFTGFSSSDFEYADGTAIAAIEIVDLPSDGTLYLNGVEVDEGEEIVSGDLDDLSYMPDKNYASTDSFVINLSTDGDTFDTTNYTIELDVNNVNDAPSIDHVSPIALTEGETTTTLGSIIVNAFTDVDADDFLQTVILTDYDGEDLGTLTYTSDNGGTITIEEDDFLSNYVVELTAYEAETLTFASSGSSIAKNMTDEVEITFEMEDSEGELSVDNDDGALSATVTIEVDDGNDAPDFNGIYATALSMTENNTLPDHGFNPAEDEETPSELTYSISGPDADQFNVDSTNGDLSFRETPDYESPTDTNNDNEYSFTLKAVDPSDASASTTVVVPVTNKRAELALSISTPIVVDENETFAMTVAATISDTSNAVTYSIGDAGGDEDLFEINQTTGVLSFKDAPDAENPTDGDSNGDYDVEIIATDTSDYSGSDDSIVSVKQTVTIQVTDIHDEDPQISSASDGNPSNATSVTVSESLGNLSITLPEASEDMALLTLTFDNGEGSTLSSSPNLSYELASTAGTSNFSFDESTGVLSLNDGASLDYETTHDDTVEIVLTITDDDSADGSSYTAETTIYIDVTNSNEPPEFSYINSQIVSDVEPLEFGEIVYDLVVDVDSEDLFFEFSVPTFVKALYHVGGDASFDPIEYNSSWDKYLTEDEFESLIIENDTGSVYSTGDASVTVYDIDLLIDNSSYDTVTIALISL